MKKIDKIFEYLENQGVTNAEFERKANISNGYLYNTRQRGSDVTAKILDKIKENLGDEFYFIFGNEQEDDKNAPETYQLERFKKKLTAPHFMVPLVPVKARGGYIKSYDQIQFLDTLEKYALPPGVSPVGAVWRYFEVAGDSMEPTFTKGDIILASQVPHDDWAQLRNFYVYIILTATDLLVKNVYALSDDEWILISENEEMYEPVKLSVNEIQEVWVMRRHIKRTSPKNKMFDIDSIIKKVSDNAKRKS